MSVISVMVEQQTPTASLGSVRGHTVMIDRPLAKEGTDAGAMGGELLLIALGGCFMSTLLAAIRARTAPIHSIVTTIDGTLEGTPPRFTAIALKINAEYTDAELMTKLVTIAERSCIVANSIRAAIPLSFSIEARELT